MPQSLDPSPPDSDQESVASAASTATLDPSSASDPPPTPSGEGEAEAKEDEEGAECGFCLFMKGGGCKDEFVAWENCVADAERSGEDAADRCMEIISTLKKCMEAHSVYYEPILRAERAMADAFAASEEGADDSGLDKKVNDA